MGPKWGESSLVPLHIKKEKSQERKDDRRIFLPKVKSSAVKDNWRPQKELIHYMRLASEAQQR